MCKRIERMLGVPIDMSVQFTEWVRGALEAGLTNPTLRRENRMQIINFFVGQINDRRANPRENDLITDLLALEVDGQPVPEDYVIGVCNLMLVAGVDTTWSAIGSSLWHLAQHPEHQKQLRDNPDLWPTAIEEFLRAYAPVTMARIVDHEEAARMARERVWAVRRGEAFRAEAHAILEKHGSRKRRVDAREVQAPEDEDGWALMNAVGDANPEGAFYDSFLDEEITGALANLPDEYRAAVVMSDLHGMRYAEIAEVLQVPEGTVKSRLFRGRRILQKELVGYAVEMGYIKPRDAQAAARALDEDVVTDDAAVLTPA